MKTLILLLLALSVQAEEMTPEFDLTTTTIIVNWFDTEEELQAELYKLEKELCIESPKECKRAYLIDFSHISAMSECEFREDFNT